MKKFLLAAACLIASVCPAQTYQPILQPHQTYVDLSGNPCAGCKIYSYAAGTTTPLATYTDASGAIQNTNPVVLDAAGGANIWIGQNAYKFALLDTFGTTLWTVDRVVAPAPGGGGPYLPLAGGTMAGAIAMASNNLLNVGSIGIGTSSPAWPLDVENGPINASGGYLYNGVAPLNHLLLGDGAHYVDSATFPWASLSGVPTIYYQQIEPNSASALPQRPTLNFDATLSATDSASPAQTNVGLPATGVTVGTYNCATVTVDAQGRINAASSNTCAPPAFTGTSSYQTQSSGLILEWGVTSAFDTGPLTVTLPFALPHGCLWSEAGDNIASSSRRIFASGNCTTTSVQIKNDGNGVGNWLVIGW